jgi:UDP-N-acetylmuramoyl-L-alanyl-D-glutamate--2,6-diaminopimelate ligase
MIAQFYGAQPDNIVAVTGTNGKTSVADFVRQIFEMAKMISASLGTLGLKSKMVKGVNNMTTPDPVKLHALLSDLKAAGVDYLAMEASSHGLHQSRLDGVKPKVAAFTNLSQDHLDYHETMENYFGAKARLFTDILPEDGYAVINIDDEWGQKISRREFTYGRHDDAALRLLSQKPKADGQDIQLQYQDEIYNIHLNLIGEFQSFNVMCAAGCCLMLGMDKQFVFESLSNLTGVSGRMELAIGKNGKAAYIDYAHTPDALAKACEAIRPHVDGRLIVVFGAGGNRDRGKRPLMGQAACDNADIVIVTDDNPRDEEPLTIRNEICVACDKAQNIGGRAKAIEDAVKMMEKGDVLLIAGKGHEDGQTIGDETLPFNDLDKARNAMEAFA